MMPIAAIRQSMKTPVRNFFFIDRALLFFVPDGTKAKTVAVRNSTSPIPLQA